MVHARPIPVADFSYSPDKPVEGLDDVIFTNTSSGIEQSKWNWYFISNAGKISTGQNSSYFFTDAGIYPVAMTVKNTWGCADTIVKSITVAPDFNVFVPNVFTPNGDNENDQFLPVTTGIKLYELMVFDRWGKKLFQTFDLKMGWDGTYNGERCQNEQKCTFYASAFSFVPETAWEGCPYNSRSFRPPRPRQRQSGYARETRCSEIRKPPSARRSSPQSSPRRRHAPWPASSEWPG